ncbi:DUF4232 domain-containing protein [Actinophytocola sp.]|uniref:DUF4232 domain-containing protein n=1 Tax=Actinophytocola sp. TaxID=1872138 RepID=UPI0025BA0C35|nr:DUF4232 domain-containing protein [Actinophytocola sp.]
MVRRIRVATVVVVGLVALLSACGNQPESTGDSRTTAPVPTTTPSLPSATTAPAPGASGTESAPPGRGTRCTAQDLRGVVQPEDAAAGNRYARLVVTNKSDAECTLYGYGGLQFVDGNGKPTPTDLTRRPDPGPSLVTLKPGATAAKKLHWGVVPSGNEPVSGPCQPPSAGIRIIPPDDTESFTVKFDFGSVCAAGHIEGSAYFEN